MMLFKGQSPPSESLSTLLTQISNKEENAASLPSTLSKTARCLLSASRAEVDQLLQSTILDTMTTLIKPNMNYKLISSLYSFVGVLLGVAHEPIFTHPCVRMLVAARFDEADSELLESYVEFLKATVNRLLVYYRNMAPNFNDKSMIGDKTLSNSFISNSKEINNPLLLFFSRLMPTYPILANCFRFYNHPDSMLRNTVHKLILSLLGVDDFRLDFYATWLPFKVYVWHLCCSVTEYWFLMDRIIKQKDIKRYEMAHIDLLIQEHEDTLVYLDDLLRSRDSHEKASDFVDLPSLTQVFMQSFANQCLSLVYRSLNSLGSEKLLLNHEMSLFLLNILLTHVTAPEIINSIVSIFLANKTEEEPLIVKPVPRLTSYTSTWRFQSWWDDKQDAVTAFVRENYIKMRESTHQIKKTQDIDSVEMQKIDLLFPEEKEKWIGYGMEKGSLSKHSIEAEQQQKGYSSTEQREEKPNKSTSTDRNPARQILISCLSSKDDTIVMLSLTLLNKILSHRLIQPALLDLCQLKDLCPTTLAIIKHSFTVLEAQNGFRVCTVTEASKLLIDLDSRLNFSYTKQLGYKIRDALWVAVERVHRYIYGGDGWDNCVQCYHSAVLLHENSYPKTLKSCGIVPSSLFKSDDSSPPLYDEEPTTEQDKMTKEFWLYLIACETYSKIRLRHPELPAIHRATQRQKGLPAKQPKYELGKKYSAEGDLSFNGSASHDDSQMIEIVLLEGFVVIGRSGFVQHKCTHLDTIMAVDMNDENIVHVTLGTKHKHRVSVRLKNNVKAYHLLKTFHEVKDTVMKYQLAMLVAEIESISALCQNKEAKE